MDASTWYRHGFVGTYDKRNTYDCRYPVFENVFYLDTSSRTVDSFAVAMPEKFFKDGTAAYQLRNYTYNYADGTVWGQDVGTDPHPVFKDAITGMSSDAMAELILHTYKGDTVAYPKYYVPGYEFSLPYVDRDNYVFQGWYENDAFTGDAVKNILADSEGDREFWAKAADASRDYLKTACHEKTGLCAEYANFDGSPLKKKLPWGYFGDFFSDAYRTAANIGLDAEWFGVDKGQLASPLRMMKFFGSDLEAVRCVYKVDGTPVEKCVLHPLGLISTIAQSALCIPFGQGEDSDFSIARRYVEWFWNEPMRKGERRYYDNCLYIFALLALSGNYRIW